MASSSAFGSLAASVSGALVSVVGSVVTVVFSVCDASDVLSGFLSVLPQAAKLSTRASAVKIVAIFFILIILRYGKSNFNFFACTSMR